MKKGFLFFLFVLFTVISLLYIYIFRYSAPLPILCFHITAFLFCFFQLALYYNFSKKIEIDDSKNELIPISAYDDLEKELSDLTDISLVYQATSNWLLKYVKATFVCFALCDGKTKPQVYYYTELEWSRNFLSEMVTERYSMNFTEQFINHSTGGISLAYSLHDDTAAVLFLGCKIDKATLVPVSRILKKVFLVLDSKTTKKEKNQLQYAFSRYISPEIVNQIAHDPALLHVGGTTKYLSVVFTDLKNFTNLSDTMEPVKLVRILNMYLNEMSEVILALGGTIDKFEGDAILAFFGAPTQMRDHAERCCRSALRMKKMEAILNEQLLHEKLITEPLETRIGINTGDMIVGNIGSLKRLDYTIIGQNVNIASRIENVNKEFNTSILISEATNKIVHKAFNTRLVKTVTLKGVATPITLYELLSEKEV